ncbi:MAG TPA: serine hydrolase domain-containing protein, partial [Hyphomicrobiales bacterium]|nr:serine hydrolase domain-containing protein [Hyphomicrobiales bacterium]
MDQRTAAAAAGFDPDRLAEIPRGLQGVVDAGDLSGIVTLLWRRGEVAQINTIGRRNVERNLPMERNSLFRIASMSKPITSVAALMLMEEGRFKLDDPIATWAPEFAEMRVLDAEDGPLDKTHKATKPITFDDLFTHRSGLAYAFTTTGPIAEAYGKALGDPLASGLDPDEWMRRLAALPLLFEPGDHFHYSHATDVLGFLVGRIAGKPFRDVLMERIFQPLGMADTDFWAPPQKRDRQAVVYRLDEAAHTMSPVAFPELTAPPAFCGGGGGLISCADDYLRFARMLLNKGELDGRRYLKAETVALMGTNRLTPKQREIPFLGGMSNWKAQGFGLGVSTVTDPVGILELGIGSTGSIGWPGAFGTWWQA